jgi:hypothetical protein
MAMTPTAINPILPALVQVLAGALCAAGLVGSMLAFRAHDGYLGARLLSLFAATLPALFFAKRYAAVLAAQSRTTIIVAAIVVFILSLLVIAALFPRTVFGFLGGLLTHTPR